MIRKNKEEREPQYYVSATNTPTLNYKVYYMKPLEKVANFLLAFIVGAMVGYLFYGGLAKNEFGEPTTTTWILNITIPTIVGIIAGRMFIPFRINYIINKRKSDLSFQFRDLLEALITSFGVGKNVNDSFIRVYDDLKVQYEEDAYILKELELVIAGIHNNIPVEVTLEDFGERSGNEDIKSFASIFAISYRKGANIKDVIKNTHNILSDKMEIKEEIETIVASSKTEQKLMIFMPIVLVGIIKLSSPEFASNFATPVGIISTTISIIIFAVAYFIGRMILDIGV